MTFGFGVASGDVSAHSIVLWTRCDPSSAVSWYVHGSDGVEISSGESRSDAGGFVHVEVDGLSPDNRYTYHFADAEGSSPVGGFRTLPVTGPVRFGVVSCAKFNSGYFNAYAALARRNDLHFVLHLGDYIYEAAQIPRGRQTPGADIGRPFEPAHECVTLADYMTRYAQYRRDPDLLALHQQHAMIATIDDHEIADNAWLGGSEDPAESDGPWPNRIRNALQAWESWIPTMRRPSQGNPLWLVAELSDVATMVLCDGRLQRSDPHAPDGPGKTILGAEQYADVTAAAKTASQPWLVVGMPSKLLPLDQARADAANHEALRGLKLMAHDEDEPYHDRWDSFATERARLLDDLRAGTASPIVLCGDVHFAAHSVTDDGGRRLIECVTSSVTSPNLDDKKGWAKGGSAAHAKTMVATIDEMQWCDLDGHGFLVMEATDDTVTCEWWEVDEVLSCNPNTSVVQRVTHSIPV